MAAQAALIADTIIGMKRARRSEDHESGPDDPITQPTNRGNKLQANARFVREGALGYINPGDYYKQKVEHAGYTRYTLQPNPPRYDSEGDELDEDDEDSEADAAAAEENPFSAIALENLLCPLKHPSELPDHPSMSHPYTSKALWDMTRAIEVKLRQERVLLWRARNLHRQFLGDADWIPCGLVETPEDRLLFEPKTWERRCSFMGQYQSDQNPPTGTLRIQNDGAPELSLGADIKEPQEDRRHQTNQTTEDDIEMADAQNHGSRVEENENGEKGPKPEPEDGGGEVGDALPHPEKDTGGQRNDDNTPNPQNDRNQPTEEAEATHSSRPEQAGGQDNADQGTAHFEPERGSETLEDELEKDAEMQDGSSPEPPRRMTTRAKANAEVANRSSSPSSDTFSSLPAPHPLFLVPDAIRPDPNFGLPPNEAEETRRLLWSYVQKQEETVRGFEHMLDSLLRACRMKDDVFEWCKAEGHLDEMSDGEDWYDREKWGLTEGEGLKKGADEDELETVDDSRATGKRGRGRRA